MNLTMDYSTELVAGAVIDSERVIDWLGGAVAGGIVAILIGVATWLIRRRRAPTGARQIWMETVPRSLVERNLDEPEATAISMQVHGQDVVSPYIVDLYLWYAGESDLPREAFDGGDPFYIDLARPTVHAERITSKGTLHGAELKPLPDTTQLHVPPGLYREGDLVHYRLITDGVPKHRFYNQVVNLDHYSLSTQRWGRTPRSTKLVYTAWIFIALGVLSFLSSLLLIHVVPFTESMTRQVLLLFGFPFFFITGFIMLQIRDVADRRTRRAEKIAKSSLGGKMLSRTDFLPVRRDHIQDRESQLHEQVSQDRQKNGSDEARAAGAAVEESGGKAVSTERADP